MKHDPVTTLGSVVLRMYRSVVASRPPRDLTDPEAPWDDVLPFAPYVHPSSYDALLRYPNRLPDSAGSDERSISRRVS